MALRAGRKLRVLEKRHNHLAKRINESRHDLSFDKEEASALRWALTVLGPLHNFVPNLTRWGSSPGKEE